MDKDRIGGAARQVKGVLKEAVGKVTGNPAAAAEGKAELRAGRAQRAVGDARDAVRGALRKWEMVGGEAVVLEPVASGSARVPASFKAGRLVSSMLTATIGTMILIAILRMMMRPA